MFRTLHEPGRTIALTIDGVPVVAQPGETVASVILRQDDAWTRQSPVGGGRRAPYCMMGTCFDCLAEIDGQGSTQTCTTLVRDGMRVRRQRGRPEMTV